MKTKNIVILLAAGLFFAAITAFMAAAVYGDLWGLLKGATIGYGWSFGVAFPPGDLGMVVRNCVFILAAGLLGVVAALWGMKKIDKGIFLLLVVYLSQSVLLYTMRQWDSWHVMGEDYFQNGGFMEVMRLVFNGILLQFSLVAIFFSWIKKPYYALFSPALIILAIWLQHPSFHHMDYWVLGFKFVGDLCENPMIMGIVLVPMIIIQLIKQLPFPCRPINIITHQ